MYGDRVSGASSVGERHEAVCKTIDARSPLRGGRAGGDVTVRMALVAPVGVLGSGAAGDQACRRCGVREGAEVLATLRALGQSPWR